MSEVNIHAAKTQFSKLLKRVAAGEEIIIARSGEPIAKLVPIEQPPKRLLGLDAGQSRAHRRQGTHWEKYPCQQTQRNTSCHACRTAAPRDYPCSTATRWPWQPYGWTQLHLINDVSTDKGIAHANYFREGFELR